MAPVQTGTITTDVPARLDRLPWSRFHWYLAVFALSNFVGALALSPLFDTIGRVRMITATYVGSGVLLIVTATMLESLTAVTLTAMGALVFFIASAGASSAYLTASELFPMETRALCIAFFFAIGTAAGGIGGALMIVGGLVASVLGVRAEGQSLESIAQPLSVEDDASDPPESKPAKRRS